MAAARPGRPLRDLAVTTTLYRLASPASTCFFFFLFSPPQTRRSGIYVDFVYFLLILGLFMVVSSFTDSYGTPISDLHHSFSVPSTSHFWDFHLGAPFH
jgi:hypothetical protein